MPTLSQSAREGWGNLGFFLIYYLTTKITLTS